MRITPAAAFRRPRPLRPARACRASRAGPQPPSPPPPPSAGGAAAGPSRAEQPIFRAGINFVRVDVIVTDRQGNPVTDLKQTISRSTRTASRRQPRRSGSSRSTPRRRRSTRSARIRTRNDEETAAADENARIFVFFLDDYHVRREQQHGGAQAARRLHRQPARRRAISSAVMYPLTPLDAVVLTRNHQGVINARREVRGPQVQLRADATTSSSATSTS